MKIQLISITLLMMVGYGFGQYMSKGLCPKRPVLQDFDIQRYTGRWYEIARYEVFFEKGCDCGYADYTLNDDDSMTVKNHCERLPNTAVRTSLGKAYISYPDDEVVEGKLNLTVTGRGPNMGSNYWILDTDYDNFSIVYACHSLTRSISAQAAWVLSRDWQLDESVKEKVDNYIDEYLVRSKLRFSVLDPEICHPTSDEDNETR